MKVKYFIFTIISSFALGFLWYEDKYFTDLINQIEKRETKNLKNEYSSDLLNNAKAEIVAPGDEFMVTNHVTIPNASTDLVPLNLEINNSDIYTKFQTYLNVIKTLDNIQQEVNAENYSVAIRIIETIKQDSLIQDQKLLLDEISILITRIQECKIVDIFPNPASSMKFIEKIFTVKLNTCKEASDLKNIINAKINDIKSTYYLIDTAKKHIKND